VTGPGGTTLVFGVPDQDATLEFSPFDVFFNETSYQGSYSLTTADFEQAVTLLKHGRIDTAPLITDEIGLDGLPDAFDRMGNVEGLKHIVIPE
jgi:NADPH2:quinone reductase